MIPYWFLFGLALLGVLLESDRPSRISLPVWGSVWFALSIFIGLRDEVGGDWGNYLGNLLLLLEQPLSVALEHGDPGYQFLSWLSLQIGWGIYGVNLACGMIFAVGLIIFCLAQPRPRLALLVAVPYLVIVVAMGYTRQAAAIGLVMIAFTMLAAGRTAAFYLFVVFAALFHKTAVVVAPLGLLAGQGKWLINIIAIALGVAGLYYTRAQADADTLVQGYLTAEYQSSGALIRVVINLVPAVLFIMFRNSMKLSVNERKFWTIISLTAVCALPAVILSPSSTAVDRLALYQIPLQLFVFSRISDVNLQLSQFVRIGIVFYYVAIQFSWLNFADNARYWIPYKSLLEI